MKSYGGLWAQGPGPWHRESMGPGPVGPDAILLCVYVIQSDCFIILIYCYAILCYYIIVTLFKLRGRPPGQPKYMLKRAQRAHFPQMLVRLCVNIKVF